MSFYKCSVGSNYNMKYAIYDGLLLSSTYIDFVHSPDYSFQETQACGVLAGTLLRLPFLRAVSDQRKKPMDSWTVWEARRHENTCFIERIPFYSNRCLFSIFPSMMFVTARWVLQRCQNWIFDKCATVAARSHKRLNTQVENRKSIFFTTIQDAFESPSMLCIIIAAAALNEFNESE